MFRYKHLDLDTRLSRNISIQIQISHCKLFELVSKPFVFIYNKICLNHFSSIPRTPVPLHLLLWGNLVEREPPPEEH